MKRKEYLVSEVKHVEETQVENAVETEEARHGGYLGAGVRREGEGGEGGRGGGGSGTQRGGGDGRGTLAEEESGERGCEGGRLRRQEVLVKHHKRVIGGGVLSVTSPRWTGQ